MWQKFIALPFFAKIAGLLGVGLVAGYGWIKRKAAGGLITSLKKAANERFWSYVRDQLKTESKQNSSALPHERTYRGTFYGCAQYANYPNEWCFTLVHDGVTTKVPIFKTNLLSGVQNGALVEIDTQGGFARGAEAVLRVRILESKGIGGFAPPT